jgi:endonuclease/exonuclease/phosphatase family metal-dependent hydrolase
MIKTDNWAASSAYRVAEVCQRPLYYVFNDIVARWYTVLTPGTFGNYDNRYVEIFRRCLLVVVMIPAGPVAIVGAVVAVGCNYLGDYLLGNRPYIRVEGEYMGEKINRCATFNMATLLPTMTLTDGVDYSSKRVRNIAALIKDFHFVCGQEVDGDSAEILIHELKAYYREFVTHIGGSNAPLIPSGLFFACKEKVINVRVVPLAVPGVQTTVKRLLVIFELETYCVATMHLDSGSGKNLAEVHQKEIEVAKAELKECTKDVILCGDFNEDRRKPSIAYKTLTDGYVDCLAHSTFFTCSDALEKERYGQGPVTQSSIDYITYRKGQKLKAQSDGISRGPGLSDHVLVKGALVF